MVKGLTRFMLKNNKLLESIFVERDKFRIKKRVLLLSNKRNRKLIDEKTHNRIVNLIIISAHKIKAINKLIRIKCKKVKLILKK